MSGYLYSAFDLGILSEFECPELIPATVVPSVFFRFRSAGEPTPQVGVSPNGGHDSPYTYISAPDGMAGYQVTGGSEIVVDPSPQMDAKAMRLFLLSSGLGAILQQRLVPVIHGSAVVTSRGAVVFAGPSGAGKSTLAAAFSERGLRVLSDEVSAIRMSEPVAVLPGPPRLMLWKDALRALGFDDSSLDPVRAELQKYFLPLGEAYQSHPAELRKIFVIETSNQRVFSLVRLKGFEKLKALTANLYRSGLTVSMGLEADYYPLIARLAAQTEISHLTRPRRPFRLEELIEVVERDLDR